MIISKWLLSEILEFTYDTMEIQYPAMEKSIDYKLFGEPECKLVPNYSEVGYKCGGIQQESENIYELAHKCKEWAFSKKINICSGIRKNVGVVEYYCTASTNTVYADTEPEAIFLACEWIRENVKQKTTD